MVDDKKNTASIIHKGASSLIIAGNSIDITKKILQERDEKLKNPNFQTLKIGHQEWMINNLNLTHYNNGDLIPNVQDHYEWCNTSSGAWCYLDNNEENDSNYGKLYNYYAITDSRGLIPDGFKLPDQTDFEILGKTLEDSFDNYSLEEKSDYSILKKLKKYESGGRKPLRGFSHKDSYYWADQDKQEKGASQFWIIDAEGEASLVTFFLDGMVEYCGCSIWLIKK